MDLQPVHLSRIGEEENVAEGGGDEEMLDEVLFFGGHPHLSPPAPVLAAVQADGVACVPRVADGDHHVFFHDEVFELDLLHFFDDLRAPLVPVALVDLPKLFHDHVEESRSCQDFPQPGNELDPRCILR
jgi:hypothetical protein